MKNKTEKQKEFNGQIDYIDLHYDKNFESIYIRTERKHDNTFICLNIDLYNFIQCVKKSDLNRFKKELIKNINKL